MILKVAFLDFRILFVLAHDCDFLSELPSSILLEQFSKVANTKISKTPPIATLKSAVSNLGSKQYNTISSVSDINPALWRS